MQKLASNNGLSKLPDTSEKEPKSTFRNGGKKLTNKKINGYAHL